MTKIYTHYENVVVDTRQKNVYVFMYSRDAFCESDYSMFINLSVLTAVFAGFLSTLLACVIIVSTKKLHGALTLDTDEGIQKVHRTPAPRVGGISLAIGYFVIWLFLEGELGDIFGLIGLAGLPALAFGMAEDVTKRVGVRARLLATIASGIIFVVLTGYTIDRVGIWGFDTLLLLPVFTFAFTAFAIGGVANSINLIDGFHGLASGTLIIILTTFGLISWQVGDATLMSLALLIAAIMAGFFVVNFPFGKIFLGDAGSLILGLSMAVFTIRFMEYEMQATGALSVESTPAVTFGILIVPLFDTLRVFSLRIFQGRSPFAADRQHIHHRLLDLGYNHLQTTVILLSVNLFFIIMSIALHRIGNINLIIVQMSLALVLSFILMRVLRRKWRKVHPDKRLKDLTHPPVIENGTKHNNPKGCPLKTPCPFGYGKGSKIEI